MKLLNFNPYKKDVAVSDIIEHLKEGSATMNNLIIIYDGINSDDIFEYWHTQPFPKEKFTGVFKHDLISLFEIYKKWRMKSTGYNNA